MLAPRSSTFTEESSVFAPKADCIAPVIAFFAITFLNEIKRRTAAAIIPIVAAKGISLNEAFCLLISFAIALNFLSCRFEICLSRGTKSFPCFFGCGSKIDFISSRSAGIKIFL